MIESENFKDQLSSLTCSLIPIHPFRLTLNYSRMTSLFPRSTSLLSSFSRLSLSSSSRPSIVPSSSSSIFQPTQLLQVRNKSLVPRRTKYRKAHKGRTPLALGGSTKGTTLEWGDYGLRVNEAVRLSAKHLETAEAALKRGLKPIRGSKVWVTLKFLRILFESRNWSRMRMNRYLRIFPDIPVCIKVSIASTEATAIER